MPYMDYQIDIFHNPVVKILDLFPINDYTGEFPEHHTMNMKGQKMVDCMKVINLINEYEALIDGVVNEERMEEVFITLGLEIPDNIPNKI